MNIDVLSIGSQDDGRYVLVSGQDEVFLIEIYLNYFSFVLYTYQQVFVLI